jgi:hypothetical protein
MFWCGLRRAGRFLRPLIAFGWPWLVLWISIKAWMWALASRGSDAAIPALLITSRTAALRSAVAWKSVAGDRDYRWRC